MQKTILTGSGVVLITPEDSVIHEGLLEIATDALGGFVAEIEMEATTNVGGSD